MAKLIRSHWAMTLWVLALIALPVIWYTAVAHGEGGGEQTPEVDQISEAEHSQLMALRETLALTPRDLAALDCSNEKAAEILLALRAWMATNRGALDTADSGVIQARRALQAIHERIHVGPRDEMVIAGLPATVSALSAAQSQREAVYGPVIEAVGLKLSSPQSEQWSAIRANVAGGLPDSVRYAGALTGEQASAVLSGSAVLGEVLSSPQEAAMEAARVKINQRLEAIVGAEGQTLVVQEGIE